MKIGILEDNEGISTFLAEGLKRSGHSPFIYQDGWQFLALFFPEHGQPQPLPFDAVLIDLILPGSLTGLEVLQQIYQAYKDLPILVISAVPAPNLETIEETYPGVRTFQKPFHLRDVLAALPA